MYEAKTARASSSAIFGKSYVWISPRDAHTLYYSFVHCANWYSCNIAFKITRRYRYVAFPIVGR